jgi:hypothetical protein
MTESGKKEFRAMRRGDDGPEMEARAITYYDDRNVLSVHSSDWKLVALIM